MDLMPVHTAQSPEFLASRHDANARRLAAHQQAAGARAAPPDLLSTDNPEVPRQYLNGAQTMSPQKTDQCNVFEKHLAQELHLRDDEDIVSRSLHYDQNIHPGSIHPTSRRTGVVFFNILEQGECEGEEGFWVEDVEGVEDFMATNDEETFWVLEENDAFVARRGGVWAKFQIQKEERQRKISKQKAQSPTRWLQTPSKKWLRRDQYGQQKSPSILGKRQRKEREERKIKFQYPYDGNKGYPSYDNGKGKGGHYKGKSKTFAATAENLEEQSANQQTVPSTEPTNASWADQPFTNKADGACDQPSAQSDLCDPGQRMYQIWAAGVQSSVLLRPSNP